MTTAFTHGRYQPVHNGHFGVFMTMLKDYENIIVGIANPLREIPERINTLEPKLRDSIYKARAPENNPYNYVIRQEMILTSLEKAGVDMNRVRVIPHFGHYERDDWREFMPSKENTEIVLPAKDTHHYSKLEVYKQEGWKVRILPQISGISGKIFDAAWPNENWRELVPKGVDEILEQYIL
ncbi:MAG: hypothetical protein KKF65_03360 [Nanoarchaeota archaeon]|nr:hypothetical protein [Nanoarchaeota archaeon]